MDCFDCVIIIFGIFLESIEGVSSSLSSDSSLVNDGGGGGGDEDLDLDFSTGFVISVCGISILS